MLAGDDAGKHALPLCAPLAGQWAVESGHVLENQEASSALKMVDSGPVHSVDSRQFRRLIAPGIKQAAAFWAGGHREVSARHDAVGESM